MALRVYNTLTRQKEAFPKTPPAEVGMYVCGPTVYKPSHIGHMVGPVIFDTVKRYLTYLGFKVNWVVNITDVDDKLIVRSREIGTTVKDLAEKMTADYVDCLRRLNVTGIDRMPRATEHIAEMIDIMRGLIAKGYGYAAGGDVYFDVTKDPDYGKLCNRDPEQMEAGSRIEMSDRKRNPGDFAMWKGSKPGEPSWESPWGPGRPGWHIECSAMSMKYLGKTLDIHGGGLDLQFPHHENELAQSESYTDQPFARVWMHNGLLKMGTAKMAGSVGNVVNIADLLQRHHAETVRFLLLSTHYRSPIVYGDDRLDEMKRSLESFYRFFELFKRVTGTSFYELQAPSTREEGNVFERSHPWRDVGSGPYHWRHEFHAVMEDDLNTAGAIAKLHSLVTFLNKFAADKGLEGSEANNNDRDTFNKCTVVLRELASILGLFWEKAGPKVYSHVASGGLTFGGSAIVEHTPASPPPNEGNTQSTGRPSAQEILSMDPKEAFSILLAQILEDLGKNVPLRPADSSTDDWNKTLMGLLIQARAEARLAKLYAEADTIRKRLAELRVTLEDRAGKTDWRVG